MAVNEIPNEDISVLLPGTEAEEENENGMIQGNRRNVNNEDEEGKKLRRYLRLYLYSAVKWRDCNLYFNLIFVIVALVQISKTVLITKQMLDLGYVRAEFQELDDRGKTTLRHLLLLHWESGMEGPPYPPAGGQYAIYTIDDLTKHINFAVEKYYSSEKDAVGIYMLPGRNDTDDREVTFCINYFTYNNVELGHGNDKAEIHDVCFKSHRRSDDRNFIYDIVADLRNNSMNESIVFNSVLKINLTFHLFSLRLDSLTNGNGRCLSIQGIISFTNKDNNGQALVDLQTVTRKIICKTINVDLQDVDDTHITEWDIANSVLALCTISFFAMLGDLIIGMWLCYKTKQYMKQNSERHFPGQENGFPFNEYFCRIKGWNLFVIIGDLCTFCPTCMIKIDSTNEVKWGLANYDQYAMPLGLGCLLCWICLARYLHFSKKFHLFFKTMYRAIPDVLRYLLCVMLLFWSFTFCGFVVLGPYHIKNISMAADTLLSTISGDEITVTLAGLETDKLGSPGVWWFAQIYLWLFISIFTIVILSILIAIFNSAYEAIQKEYKKQKKYKKRKENADPLRKILRELLHTNDNSEGGIEQVRNGFLQILEQQDDSDMSPRERILRQELEAVDVDNDTSRKPTIKAFMDSGEERLNTLVKWWIVPCIFSVKDIKRLIVPQRHVEV